jgi:hypothetical protein
MPDDDYQSPDDERQDQGPTPDELQAAEMAKTAQTLQLVQAMNQTVAPLPMTLPTQTAPAGAPPPAPMTTTQPPPVAPVAPPPQPGAGAGAGYQFGRGIGVLAAPPTPTNQGRMYMGPAMAPDQEQQFMQSAPGTRMNLMPPPAAAPAQDQATMQARLAAGTGRESDAAALARLQAADTPDSRTIAVRSESPYSDASLANQRNAMLYNAMKKFDAGDRSPEVMAAALGSAAPKPMTEYQRTMAAHRKALEDQAARRVVPARRDMVLENAIRDERAALNKVRTDLSKTPATDGTDRRIQEALYHERKLKELTGQYQQSQPSTATATAAPPVQAPVAPAAKVKSTPSVGEIRNGYRFKGGDPSKKANWEQV